MIRRHVSHLRGAEPRRLGRQDAYVVCCRDLPQVPHRPAADLDLLTDPGPCSPIGRWLAVERVLSICRVSGASIVYLHTSVEPG